MKPGARLIGGYMSVGKGARRNGAFQVPGGLRNMGGKSLGEMEQGGTKR